jgi:hypothetical protein
VSDDQQIVVVPATQVVAVPEPAIQRVVDERIENVVVDAVDVEVILVERDSQVVDESQDISILTVGEQGPRGIQGLPGSVQSTVTRVAAIDVGGQRVVVLDDSEKVIYADRSIVAHADKILGVTTGAAVTGADATVQTYGEMDDPSFAFTPGGAVYASVNGLMTQTAPSSGFSRAVGYAMAATKLFIDLGVPTIRA